MKQPGQTAMEETDKRQQEKMQNKGPMTGRSTKAPFLLPETAAVHNKLITTNDGASQQAASMRLVRVVRIGPRELLHPSPVLQLVAEGIRVALGVEAMTNPEAVACAVNAPSSTVPCLRTLPVPRKFSPSARSYVEGPNVVEKPLGTVLAHGDHKPVSLFVEPADQGESLLWVICTGIPHSAMNYLPASRCLLKSKSIQVVRHAISSSTTEHIQISPG